MEGRRHRVSAKANNNNNNNTDSPFYFLKTLCEYGNTLVKEINELGKDFVDNNGETLTMKYSVESKDGKFLKAGQYNNAIKYTLR